MKLSDNVNRLCDAVSKSSVQLIEVFVVTRDTDLSEVNDLVTKALKTPNCKATMLDEDDFREAFKNDEDLMQKMISYCEPAGAILILYTGTGATKALCQAVADEYGDY